MLPIFKAGMMPGALPLFITSMAFCLFFASVEFPFQGRTYMPWFLVWLIFSTAVFVHVFIIPKIYGLFEWLPFYVFDEAMGKNYASGVSVLSAFSVWGYFSAMWIVAWRVSYLDKNQLPKLIFVIFLCSLFQATYGLWHLLSAAESVLGLWDKVYGKSDVTGTFVNRNHFSAMLGMTWPIVLSSLLRGFSKTEGYLGIKRPIAVVYSLLVAVALVTSHSRMGVTAAVVGLIVWGVVFVRSKDDYDGVLKNEWLPWLIILVSLLFSVWFGIEDIILRYTILEGDNARTEVWAAMFDLPIMSWIVGIGPGMFADVFHLVQPQSFDRPF